MTTFVYPSEPPHLPQKPGKPANGEHFASTPENPLWFTHDPAIYHDPASNNYYIYATEAKSLRSKDLIHWEDIGRVTDVPPAESHDHVGTNHIWAPDIVKVGEEYRLYCSNSSFGVRQSCIYLAVSDNAEGPFIPRGAVIKTTNDSPVNAIDANIIEDHTNGKQYMVYGSFWGGCHIIELDKTTGLAAEDGVGTCLVRRPQWCDSAVEGPYIVYNKDRDYYYLFVSYASLKSDYNIRVGRSKCVTGPYLDHNGRDLTDLEDYDNSIGYMIACGYQFHEGISYMGPGHNSVLHDFDNEWYLVSHIRERNFKGGEPSMMHVRKMLWTNDGWPVVSPEIYSGEKVQPVTKELMVGKYERIRLTPTIPQGVQTSVCMSLFSDGRAMLADSIHAQWTLIDDTTFVLTYAKTTETYRILPTWDYELWQPTIAITGKDDKGICLWGKKWGEI
ncbi:arabinan endo-1,5-alpha-L-arabinosidase [Anaerosporobacter sp.]|uniref:arabinan endo-1,5-alpha-L-arabinosidase n=1 Tax=Anaerosporobacter sp. TaxID=1872529 RepID=UPI00286F994B|nr:arabinan endo-1,5-alpha-L-arabinosidase [Anaerosporobacter sp.]